MGLTNSCKECDKVRDCKKRGEMMEKKFIECLTKFQLTDLLGFGKMLNVEENDDFIEYISNIVAAALEKALHGKKKTFAIG